MPVGELPPEGIAAIRRLKEIFAISVVISFVWVVCVALIIYWEETTEFDDRPLFTAVFPWFFLLLIAFIIISLLEWAMIQDPPDYQIIDEVLDRIDPPRVRSPNLEDLREWQERHRWLDELEDDEPNASAPLPPAQESNTNEIEEEEAGPSNALIRRSGWKH